MFGVLFSIVLFVEVFPYSEGQFTINAVPSYAEVQYGQDITLFYHISPWPPPCCKSNTDWDQYKSVRVDFMNLTSNEVLCTTSYTNGTWNNDTSAYCSPRLDAFSPDYNDKVHFVIQNVDIYDRGRYEVVLHYGGPEARSDATVEVLMFNGIPNITLTPAGDLDEGDHVIMTCKVTNVNPPADLEWSRDGTVIRPRPENYTKATDWHDYTISGIRVGPLNRYDHGRTYQCKAENERLPGISISSSVTLNVRFQPYVRVGPCQQTGLSHRITEGSDIVFTCNADAYPLVSARRWDLDGTDDPAHFNKSEVTVMNMTRIEGNRKYGCTATNTKGDGHGSCHIDIQYGPTITMTKEITIQEYGFVNVSCTYTANPKPHIFQWTKHGDPAFELTEQHLVLQAAGPDDLANYTCTAINQLDPTNGPSFPYTATGTVYLMVEYTPRLVPYAMDKFTGRVGQNTTVECQARGFPIPQLYWTRNGVNITSSPQIQIETVGSVSRMKIKTVQENHFGMYHCNVKNKLAHSSLRIQLLKPGKPDAPQECEAQTVTDREVTLHCIAGYSGGEAMWFDVQKTGEGVESEFMPTSTEWNTEGLAVIDVSGFGPNTSYTLYVHGKNQHGRSSDAFEVLLTTEDGPPLPTSPPPNVGAIVGGVFGGLIAVLLIIGLVVYFKRNGMPKMPETLKEKKRQIRFNMSKNQGPPKPVDEAQRKPLRSALKRPASQEQGLLNSAYSDENGTSPYRTSVQNEYLPHPGITRQEPGYESQNQLQHRQNQQQQQNTESRQQNGQQQQNRDSRSYQGQQNGYGNSRPGQGTPKTRYHDDVMETSLDTPDFKMAPMAYGNRASPNRQMEAQNQRSQQTNLAGMGALSHASMQSLPQEFSGHPQRAASSMQSNPQAPPRRNKENKQQLKFQSQEPLHVEPQIQVNNQPDDRFWEYPRERLYIRQKLGEGSFGEVWRATADNITGQQGQVLVAVKMLKDSSPKGEQQSMMNELQLMKSIGPHPNVIALLGCCARDAPVFIIMEYAENGNLQDFLRSNRSTKGKEYVNLHGSSKNLTTRDLTVFAHQVACGMEFIAKKELLHRDLAVRNVLVDKYFVCKIADFGFARDIVHSRQYESKTQRRLPIRWMAPESLFDCIYTTKSDVWSFGILLWEIVTLGSTPYPAVGGSDVMEMIQMGHRMDKPRLCPRSLYMLMCDCWRADPDKRPNFSRLRERLDVILDDITEAPETNLQVQQMKENMFAIIQNSPGERC